MEKSAVKILSYGEHADRIVASAGRISTTKGSAIEIYEQSCKKEDSENIKLIHKILSSGHTSVLEHIFLNIAFENVSVFVEQFMIEFRLASFTVKSRRYVDFGTMGYVMPAFDKSEKNAEQNKAIYQAHMEFLFEQYRRLLDCGIPKEDARFILPYSFRSNFYCTVNARELVKIVDEMIWGRGRAYQEIVSLGTSLMEQAKERLPFLTFGSDSDKGATAELLPQKKAVQPENSGEPVVLLNATENPEETICRAALLQEGTGDWTHIDIKDPALQKRIIKAIMRQSRRRELEQAQFTILFRQLSLACVTHLVRHRMQSIIVPKYVNVCDFRRYIVPDSILQAGLKEAYEDVFVRTQRVLERLREQGMKTSDTVYLLLSGLTIPVMTTMNANELLTFIRLRCCNRAQWEIADHAKALLKVLRKQYPTLFSLYGPTCYVTGHCPEGRMSCGRINEVMSEYAANE